MLSSSLARCGCIREERGGKTKHVFCMKQKTCLVEVLVPTLSGLGQGTNSLGGKLHFDAVDALGLKIDLKRAPSGDIGMASRIAGSGLASGHLAYAAHIQS